MRMMRQELQRPKLEPLSFTNQIMKQEKQSKTLYYLPCYVRFKVKELVNIDVEKLQATVSGALLFSFYYGNLDRGILQQFTGDGKKAILLQFIRQDGVLLKEAKGITFKQQPKQKLIQFVVRQDFKCVLDGDVFYTPFEFINLYLTVTVQSLSLDPRSNNGGRVDIKFNCMTCDEIRLISHGDKIGTNNYNLAKRYLATKYTNNVTIPFERIQSWDSDEQDNTNKKPTDQKTHPENAFKADETNAAINLIKHEQQLEKDRENESPQKLLPKEDPQPIKNFQYAHFRIPLYRYPAANLVNIFVPLVLLGFINITIFFSEVSLGGRIKSLATLTLALIAFVPTINKKIPQTQSIKLIQIIIYSYILSTVLCLIDSLILFLNYNGTAFVFDWRHDVFFILTFIINILSIVIMMILFGIHKLYWEKQYTRPSNLPKKQRMLVRKAWHNKACDRYFEPFLKEARVNFA